MVYLNLKKNDGDVSSAALSTGGLLNPKQGNKFVDLIYDITGLNQLVNTVKFDNQSMNIDKVNVDARVVYPMDEGVDTGKRAGISTSQVTLTPFQVMTVIDVTDQFMKQNIEGQRFKVLERFGMAIANNLEDFNLNADIIGPTNPESMFVSGGSTTKRLKDVLLAKRDGWMRQADAGHVVDAANSSEISRVLIMAKKAMPIQFRKNLKNLKFIGPIDLEDNYQYELSLKNTVLGDMTQTGQMSLNAFGISLRSIPLMSSTPIKVQHVTLTGTTPVALRYKPIDNATVWVTSITIDGETAETPYIDTTDYVIDETNGTIANSGSGAIASGTVVKVTYYAPPELLLTDPMNLMIAMNTDSIKIEKTRIAVRLVDQYTISAMIDVKIINPDAVVKVININPDILN